MIQFKSWFFVIIILTLTVGSCKKDDVVVDDVIDDGITTYEPTKVGLVSFYDFQGNANDTYGDNNGIENNVSYINDSTTNANQFLQLEGVNNYVDLTNPFDYSEKTISLWLYVEEVGSNLGIIYASDNPTLENGLTVIYIKEVDSEIKLSFNVAGEIKVANISQGTWYNATVVTSNDSYKYYLNGSLVGSGVFDKSICSSDGAIATVIGCDRTMSNRFFNGLVDNLRIYDRALLASEIETIYKAKFSY